MKKVFKVLAILSLIVLFACGKQENETKVNSQEKTIEKKGVEQTKTPTKEVVYDLTTKKEDIGTTVTVEKGETFYVLGKEKISVPYDFEIGKYEVTNKEFVEFLNNYKVSKDGTYKGKPMYGIDSKHSQIGYDDKKFFIKPWKDNKGRDIDLSDYPIMWVYWYGAVAYCNWLSEKSGLDKVYDESTWISLKDEEIVKKKGYRLPTRNEWIYAMQGGNKSTGTKFAGSDNLDEVAWHLYTSMADGNSALDNEDGIISGTTPVGLLKSNELGIFDMLGNNWEWTNTDSYGGKMLLGSCWSDGGRLDPRGMWVYEILDYTGFNNGFRIMKTK